MMKRFICALALCVALVAGVGCQQLTDLEAKVDQNTSDIKALKEQIAKLQEIVNAGYVITDTKEITGGYEFTLSNGKKITVTNGKDGKDGVDGADGKDGKDGKDGVDGKDGKDGKDGVDGKDGKDGDSFFGSVTVDTAAGIVKIVLTDGTAFNIPLASDKGIVEQVSQLTFIPEFEDLSVTFNYFDEASYDSISFYVAVFPASATILVSQNMDKVNFMVAAYALQTRTPIAITIDSNVTFNEDGGAFYVKADPKEFFKELGFDTPFCLAVMLADDTHQVMTDNIPVYRNCTALEYAGEKYHTTQLADGKTWMAENLRYLPDGAEPSLDPTNTSAGIWFPVDLSTKALTSDENVIKEQGYLYTADFAFGQTITAENYDSFEGCQGICPGGWHIPTGAEIFEITGRLPNWPGSKTATTPGDKSSESPYNNSTETTLGNCMMSLLNSDGFNAACTGCISVVATSDKHTASNAMGYYLGSTAYKYNPVAAKVPVAYAQYNVFMPMKSNGSCNGAQASNRSGFAVRCVKD